MTKFFYFSGTGNTLWSAKKIAELLGGESELFNIGVEMRKLAAGNAKLAEGNVKLAVGNVKPPGTIEADRVILLFPAYAYQAPLMARRFLQRSEIRSPYIAALVTFGTDPGGALAEVSRVLKRKNIMVSFFGVIPSVENYIPIFGPPPEQKKEKRLAMQREAAERIAQAIHEQKTNRVWTVRPFSMFISSLFRLGKPLFVKSFKVDAECNGCGICARICPAANITMNEHKPVFAPLCEHCQACLNWCPRRAIRYMRMKPDTPRYHHPEVTLPEMFSGSDV
jgi:ferredoxin